MKIKKILYCIFLLLFIGFIYVVTQLLVYRNDVKNNYKLAEVCYKAKQNPEDIIKNNVRAINDEKSCFCRMHDLLLPSLLIHRVLIDNEPLKFFEFPISDDYIVPVQIAQKADVYLSVKQEPYKRDFEKFLYDTWKKPVYFLEYTENNNNQNIQLYSIAYSDPYTYTFSKNKYYNNFEQIFNDLKLKNKKIFIKFDLNSNMENIMSEILRSSENISGFVFLLRYSDSSSLTDLNKLFQKINKNFILVHRTANDYLCIAEAKCRYSGTNLPSSQFLTYVNKNLVNKKYLPFKQDYSRDNDYKEPYKTFHITPEFKINRRVILYEKLKNIFKKDK